MASLSILSRRASPIRQLQQWWIGGRSSGVSVSFPEALTRVPELKSLTPKLANLNPSFLRQMSSLSTRAAAAPPPHPTPPRRNKEDIVTVESDLESEESLWDLYERWIERYEKKRSPLEKKWRFHVFCKIALFLHYRRVVDGEDFSYCGFTGIADIPELELLPNLRARVDRFVANGCSVDPPNHHPGLGGLGGLGGARHYSTSLQHDDYGDDYEEEDRDELGEIEIVDSDLSDTTIWALYERWIRCYEKKRTPQEMRDRFHKFARNVMFIMYLQAKGQNIYGLNSISDLSQEDYLFPTSGPTTLSKPEPYLNRFVAEPYNSIPTSLDWRTRGAVTAIRTQLNNNSEEDSSWAFSAVDALEGVYQIKTAKLHQLSVQQLIDCAIPDGVPGCMERAIGYVINKGVTTEQCYPYTGSSRGSKINDPAVSVQGYCRIRNEKALLKAVAKQPVCAWITCPAHAFKNYVEGVFEFEGEFDESKEDAEEWLRHAVTIVGYGVTSDGVKYWIIKNCWGPKWGEEGFMRMKRGVNLGGVANHACFPRMTFSFPPPLV